MSVNLNFMVRTYRKKKYIFDVYKPSRRSKPTIADVLF